MFVPPGALVFDQSGYAATAEGIARFQLDFLSPDGPRKLLAMPKIVTLTAPMAAGASAIIRAGDRLYAGGAGFLAAAPLPLNPESPDPLWQIKLDGNVVDLAAASQRLFAMTDRGRLYCFAAGGTSSDATKPTELLASASSPPRVIETR